mmetsp:Transcript_77882/g.147076  ORF Transcript_77882/g.147076 Transcript_77882/m.147076 type:complete len:144 (+) Transcript_77882:659-1090(+)
MLLPGSFGGDTVRATDSLFQARRVMRTRTSVSKRVLPMVMVEVLPRVTAGMRIPATDLGALGTVNEARNERGPKRASASGKGAAALSGDETFRPEVQLPLLSIAVPLHVVEKKIGNRDGINPDRKDAKETFLNGMQTGRALEG